MEGGVLNFSPEILDSLRGRLPDYLAARGVELRRNGTRLVGRCPVHDDRAPSFAVFGTHHETCGCFPCGFSGDVFEVSKWLGRSSTFPEAVADVAATLGVYLPQSSAGTVTRPATAPPRPAKQPEPPFVLTDSEREKIHAARLAFSDAFDAGDLDATAAELGIPLPALRECAMGKSGLGVHEGLLSYIYPEGLKVRRAAGSKPRFLWVVGRATMPWRFDWVNSDTRTVFLTEGESDCMALVASGLEADGTAVCIASPGTSFPREWAPLFRGKRVVLCFDGDSAGRAATATVAAILKGHADEILTWKGPASNE